jgi:hypothetical protein
MQLESTYGRILCLDTAVELSPDTVLQYHATEERNFWKESTSQTKVTKESEDHFFDDNTFFDSYENLPSFHEEFFDCFEEEEFENNEQHRARIVIDCTKEIIGTASTQE